MYDNASTENEKRVPAHNGSAGGIHDSTPKHSEEEACDYTCCHGTGRVLEDAKNPVKDTAVKEHSLIAKACLLKPETFIGDTSRVHHNRPLDISDTGIAANGKPMERYSPVHDYDKDSIGNS